MASRIQRRLLWTILLVALAGLAGCSEDREDLVVSLDPAAEAQADAGDAMESENGTVADDSAPVEIAPIPPTSRSGLVGTAWAVTSVNGEPYEGGELAIAENSAAGETYRIAFADPCSAGTTWFRVHSDDDFEVYPDRNAPCPGHPTSVLRGEAKGPITVSLQDDELFIETANGTLTAVLTSTSADGTMPPLTMLPVVDVEWPDADAMRPENLSKIEEATDIRVPECPTTGEAGLEPDPLADERLATSQRFGMVIGQLPFVVSSSGSGGNLYHHEMGIGLSVRYQPTIDWIADNMPEGHVCIEIPPVGHYDRGPSLAPWELVAQPGPADTTLSLRFASDCAPSATLVMDPVVVETDTSVEIALPLAQAPYGAAFDAMCAETTPTMINLDSPLGDREIVPLTSLSD